MTRSFLPIALAIALVAGSGGPVPAQDAASRSTPMSDPRTTDVTPRGTQLIVSYAADASDEAIEAAQRAVRATVVRRIEWNHAVLLRLPIGADTMQAIAILKAQPAVREVELDARMTVTPIRGPRVGG